MKKTNVFNVTTKIKRRVHGSFRVVRKSSMEFQKHSLFMGSTVYHNDRTEFTTKHTDSKNVKAILNAITKK